MDNEESYLGVEIEAREVIVCCRGKVDVGLHNHHTPYASRKLRQNRENEGDRRERKIERRKRGKGVSKSSSKPEIAVRISHPSCTVEECWSGEDYRQAMSGLFVENKQRKGPGRERKREQRRREETDPTSTNPCSSSDCRNLSSLICSCSSCVAAQGHEAVNINMHAPREKATIQDAACEGRSDDSAIL